MRHSQVHCLRLYPLAIPLRRPFHHAAHSRSEADPVVVEVELGDGTLGYGETLARPYVTGETVASVIQTLREVLADELLGLRPESFPEVLERIEGLPDRDRTGAIITAARAGLELALLDAYSKHFERPISEVAGWLGLPGFGPPGSVKRVAYSAVISGGGPDEVGGGADEVKVDASESGSRRRLGKLRWTARLMRWYGLRDFKLKIGNRDDPARVAAVARVLGRSLGAGTTLRLDANGAWNLEEAVRHLEALPPLPIACVEQPLNRMCDADLAELRRRVPTPIMPDESLITMDDARQLSETGAVDLFNIRLAKNGGFIPALKLAHYARQRGLGHQLGCMVGETSILSAAGRHFLENVPEVRFAEGSYGRFLLRGDVVARPVQFGWGGRVKPLAGFGWGIEVSSNLLKRYVRPGVIEIRL